VTRIVIDASVTLSWCFPDEQTHTSMNVLDRLKAREQALAPAFWAPEVLNTLLVGERNDVGVLLQSRAESTFAQPGTDRQCDHCRRYHEKENDP
jgi:predicted nucleic acid-binding protein